MFKVNNRKSGTGCYICSKLTIKKTEFGHFSLRVKEVRNKKALYPGSLQREFTKNGDRNKRDSYCMKLSPL